MASRSRRKIAQLLHSEHRILNNAFLPNALGPEFMSSDIRGTGFSL